MRTVAGRGLADVRLLSVVESLSASLPQEGENRGVWSLHGCTSNGRYTTSASVASRRLVLRVAAGSCGRGRDLLVDEALARRLVLSIVSHEPVRL